MLINKKLPSGIICIIGLFCKDGKAIKWRIAILAWRVQTGGMDLKKRSFIKGAVAAALISGVAAFQAPAVQAQEVTLKLHQFLPAQANVPKFVLEPWMQSVMDASGGKMKIEMYSAMALGGKPPELIDQVKDGVVDIAWTVVGYTPGRFPRTEVFELPFMMTNAEATSKAYWDLFESDMKDQDFKDYHIIGTWVHGPGVIHAKGDGVQKLEDMKGKKLGFADPDSTSGFLVPSVTLPNDIGMSIGEYFADTGFGGGHENLVLEVVKGTFDAGTTWASGVGDFSDGYTSGNLRKMVDKGIVDMDDLVELWKSPLIPNGPIVVRTSMDADMKGKFKDFMMKLPESDPECFSAIQGGDYKAFTEVTPAFYEAIIAARKAKIGS